MRRRVRCSKNFPLLTNREWNNICVSLDLNAVQNQTYFQIIMRHTRIKLPAPASYHITSRIKNDDFLLEDAEDKRDLLNIIRRTAAFSGITVMSYTILDNHFHLLVHIPVRQEIDNAELERRVRTLYGDETAADKFERWQYWELRGKSELAEKERRALRHRMYDISPFVKEVKQLFTRSYNRRHEKSGTVWGRSRFKSAAVASDFKTLATVAAYIDLNAVRARIARRPKNYKWCGFGAANKGDTLALSGLAALVKADKIDVNECCAADCKAALEEYMRFLDGTKKSGDTHSSKNIARRSVQREHSAQYVRKTLDSADLSKLGTEGVERWLAESEIKPESLSEMWTRRFGNFVVGGIIGPLTLMLEARDGVMVGAGMRRWRPGMFEGVCSFIRERNEKARKQNAA